MEEWQLEFEWLRVRHWIKNRFNRKELPDLNAVLYLIGIQELGRAQEKIYQRGKAGFDAHCNLPSLVRRRLF